jgi:formylglycine-generating enzyme required for sulfatase activity
MTTGKIFISYRRSESPKDALLVFKHLQAEFGLTQVFMDVDGIRPGDDFIEVLERQLDDCTVLLALIGPDWLHARNEHGERKLDDEHDFVRLEIRTALDRKLRVVPLLLDGAPMPRKVDLPDDLHLLLRRQALKVDATDHHAFRGAMDRLVSVVAEALAGAGVQPAHPVHSSAATAGAPAIIKPRAKWMSDEGTDQFGRWADFKVDSVVQRLRWIEPGEFWMGSTEAERRRFSEGASDVYKKWIENEKPRHRVRLTQGYWLADTACTQALWQAVTGDNPSNFTGDLKLPVEQVSWNDITQQFLPELNRRVPGLRVVLPTEAQWEYACRAGTGTDTAYCFGETITPEQINFDGNYPPPGGAKGLYRKKTVPVKALPGNTWGLYQMHGNVLEWCVDGKRTYEAGTASDPVGPQDQGAGERVLRGGGWINFGRYCRSASRSAFPPVDRNGFIGFRLARGLADQ